MNLSCFIELQSDTSRVIGYWQGVRWHHILELYVMI